LVASRCRDGRIDRTNELEPVHLEELKPGALVRGIVVGLGVRVVQAERMTDDVVKICECNKWAEEARAYNGLIESWREIIKIRDTLPDETAPGPAQSELAL
jgi:hypothetical protein